MTVSEYIAQTIVNWSIHDVFLLSGGGMMYMLDALGRNKGITIHCHNHEQDAGIAAEAYARISGKPGVCFATSGPGGLNAVEAISECWVDSVPVIFFIGQNKLSQTTRGSGIKGLRQHGASEIDIIPVVKSITKGAFFLDNPQEAKSIIDRAFLLAQKDRPGPVVVQVPLDIQNANVDECCGSLDLLALAWESAKRPLLCLGSGAKDGSLGIHHYASHYKIPIVTTQMAKDLFPYTHPNFIGHFGIKGDRAGNLAVQRADVILCIGTSLHVFNTGYDLKQFAPNAKIFYCESDTALKERCGLTNATIIDEDASSLAWALNCDIEREPCPLWLDALIALKNKYPVYAEPHKEEEDRLNIYKALEIINKWSDEGDTIISDAGSSFYAVGQAWQNKQDQRYISSNGLGTMGWAIPAATGAYIANKKRVLCFTGDGSFITGINELSVIAKEKPDVKIFVFNNDGYVSIRNTQKTFFDSRFVGTDMEHGVLPAPIEDLADAYGLDYCLAYDEESLIMSLAEMNDGPTIIEILTNIDQEIIPTVESHTDADGKIVSGTLGNMYPYLEEE